MVKASRYSKVKLRKWFGSRSLYLKKGSEVMVLILGLIQYHLHVLRWKFMHWVRSLKSKLVVSFYFSFSLDQEVSFQAAWYYLPVSLSHKNIHNKFENKKQKMSKLCVFHVHLLLFLLPQCIENFFLVDNISNFFAFYFFLVCTFFSNTTISIALWWLLSLEQIWCWTAQLITSLL